MRLVAYCQGSIRCLSLVATWRLATLPSSSQFNFPNLLYSALSQATPDFLFINQWKQRIHRRASHPTCALQISTASPRWCACRLQMALLSFCLGLVSLNHSFLIFCFHFFPNKVLATLPGFELFCSREPPVLGSGLAGITQCTQGIIYDPWRELLLSRLLGQVSFPLLHPQWLTNPC